MVKTMLFFLNSIKYVKYYKISKYLGLYFIWCFEFKIVLILVGTMILYFFVFKPTTFVFPMQSYTETSHWLWFYKPMSQNDFPWYSTQQHDSDIISKTKILEDLFFKMWVFSWVIHLLFFFFQVACSGFSSALH